MMNTQENKDYKGYARDIFLIAGAQVIVGLLQFIRLPVLTKWLGASQYGTWSIIWVTVNFITPLVVLGLTMAMVRFLASEKDLNKIREGYLSIVFTVLVTGILASLIVVLCSGIFAGYVLEDLGQANLIKFAAIMIITQSLSQVSFAFFRTFRQMKIYSAFIVSKSFIEVALMASFLVFSFNLSGVISAVIISDVLCIIIAFCIAIRKVGFCLPHFIKLKSYLKYSLPLIPSSVIIWIIHSSDRYIIEYFLNSRDVGIYAAAYTMANIISFFLAPLQIALLPMLSKSYDEKETTKTRAYLKYSLKYLMMILIPAAFGLSVLNYPLLHILTSADFTSGSAIVPFVAFGLLGYSLYQVCIHIFYLVKKTFWILILLCIAAILNICLNFLLIPGLGIVGAAIATLIAYAVLGLLTAAISFKYFKFDLNLIFMVKSIFASFLMAIIIRLINPSGIIMVIISILAGIVIYFAAIFILKGFKRSEYQFFKELLRRPRSIRRDK